MSALIAIPAAVLYGLLAYVLLFPAHQNQLTFAFFGILLSLPAAISSLAVIFSDPRGQASGRDHARTSALAVLWAIVLCYVVLREGGICVVMASPIYFVIGPLTGTLTGWLLRRMRARTLSCVAIILPLAALPVDQHLTYPDHTGTVTTVIEIDAPPSVVWHNTVAIRHLQPDEIGWTFTHGIVGVPRPVDARLEGQGVGAVRYLEWGQGIRFQEHITTWEQDRFLGWRFHFDSDSIPAAVESHIRVNSNYLRLSAGFYRLDMLPNGHTRLTLTTEYQIATPINRYCAWWGNIFLNDFHHAVLGVIRDRSERAAGEAFSVPAASTPL